MRPCGPCLSDHYILVVSKAQLILPIHMSAFRKVYRALGGSKSSQLRDPAILIRKNEN
jgi:hypothetical protein